MSGAIPQLVDALKKLVTEGLLANGELKAGETVVIKAFVVDAERKCRKSFSIEEGVDTFHRSGNVFYSRELTAEEIQILRGITFADEWKRGVVSEIVNNNNAPIIKSAFPDLAIKYGYRMKSGIFNEHPTLYPDSVLGGINQALKQSFHPFRLLKEGERKVDGRLINFYRFYRIAEAAKEEK